jgi:hypothetical protein
MNKKESFNKIKNESYFTSPPYNYDPSIAEYLSTFNVTKNGFLADIMHMDHNKNIKITEFKEDYLLLKLIDPKDLDENEIIIWDYLKSLESNKEIKLYIKKIPKRILKEFWISVMFRATSSLGRDYVKQFNRTPEKNKNYLGVVGTRILLGILFTIFNFYGILTLISLIMGLKKISKEKQEIKFFFKKFLWRYIKVSILYIILFIIIIILVISIPTILKSEYGTILRFTPLFLIGILILWIYIFYQYCKILYDYINWLFESKQAGEHRRNWLEFKKFVIDHSELEKNPLSHYRLWGPFYYYTLAVGGIKNEYIR